MIINEIKKKFLNSKDIADIMRTILEKESEIDQQKEHFWVIGVNVKNVIQHIELVSLGILNSSLVHPRETFRLAILKGVFHIVCVHNHPGGCAEPSHEDIVITNRLSNTGDIIGIKLLDHVIIGNGSSVHYSFKDSGTL